MTSNYTKHSVLTDEEFLRVLEDVKDYSPLLEECYVRITKKLEVSTCPICEGDITAYQGDQ